MTDLLTLGASGLRAYRAALAAVSENIANADDRDYTRRVVRLAEAPANQAVNPIYLRNNDFHGAVIGGVERQTDMFAEAQLRLATGDQARASAQAQWIGAAETALADGPNGVGPRIAAFFDAGTRAAARPGDPAVRAEMHQRLDFAVRGINQTAARLAEVASGTATAAGEAAASANQALTDLASINTNLLRSTPGTQSHAALLDRRDAALRSLSAVLPVDIAMGTHGTVSLDHAGTMLLGPGVRASLDVLVAADGRLALQIDGAAVGAAPPAGAFAGLIGAAEGIARQREALDTLAADLAASLNAWNSAGQTHSGAPGAALLAGTTAATLALATADPDALAGAAGGAANGNYLALAGLRAGSGAEQSWINLVQFAALQTQQARADDAAATRLKETAEQARDQVSGVDLDREAAEMLRLQQAYDATARVLQVARDTIQSILNIF